MVNEMKLLNIFLISLFLVPVSWAGSNFEVQAVDQKYQRWYFRNLQVVAQDDSINVKGKMTAMNRYGLPDGYINVKAYSPKGEVIAETSTRYVPAVLSKRAKSKGGVKFSAMFTQPIPAGSTFKVAFQKSGTAQ